jgi:hypothetical protein
MSERAFPNLSSGMKAHLKDGAKGTLVDLVLGALLGPLGSAFGFLRGVHEKSMEEADRLNSAPWKMSYEHLSQHLSRE